jgi:hypothetical protein
MKTMKSLLFILILVVLSVSKSFAGGNENENQAYAQLNTQLKNMLQKSDITVFNRLEKTFVVLTFSVNEKHQMENVRVESTDESLTSYVKEMLQQKKVEVDPSFDGKSGQVLIVMENNEK